MNTNIRLYNILWSLYWSENILIFIRKNYGEDIDKDGEDDGEDGKDDEDGEYDLNTVNRRLPTARHPDSNWQQ